jgi:F420-non-reducing hydrogenase iron-sulfur subunit
MSEKEGFEPKIIGFLCNWCAYAGADLAGVSRIQYPPNIRIIRVMCSGRIDPAFILEALKDGADGVLVAGCHLPSDCHYISGNFKALRRRQVCICREKHGWRDKEAWAESIEEWRKGK